MTSYALADVIHPSIVVLDPTNSDHDVRNRVQLLSTTTATKTTSSNSTSNFDEVLHTKLMLKKDDESYNQPSSINSTYSTIRSLFCNAALALEEELSYNSSQHQQHHYLQRQRQQDSATIVHDNTTIKTNCHWIPGRIEIMGKHTDYAGGNSFVCATSQRGMAIVSTVLDDMEDNGDDQDEDEIIFKETNNNTNSSYSRRKISKVTIVSVLPPGMEHHATKNTSAPYQVVLGDGRIVVRHTIDLSIQKNDTSDELLPQNNGNCNDGKRDKDNEGDCSEARAIDWTIYPTAVIHRLKDNFGLFHHRDGEGGHLFIAISSNLPPASGLSTSSALVSGIFLAVNSHVHLCTTETYRNAIGDPEDSNSMHNLSTYLGNVENGMDYKLINSNGFILKGTAHGGVVTFGGSEDHAAILLGKIGELHLLSFCPTRMACLDMLPMSSNMLSEDVDGEMQYAPLYPPVGEKIDPVVHLPPDLTFVVAYCGVKAEKAGSIDGASIASTGYNNASDLARCALHAYLAGVRRDFGNDGDDKLLFNDIQTLADAVRWERSLTPSVDVMEIRSRMSNLIKSGAITVMGGANIEDGCNGYVGTLIDRFVHFYNESECLVPAAAYALMKKNYDLLGTVVDASHRNAVNLLKNQIEETAWLPLWARGKEHTLQTSPLLVIDAHGSCIDTNNTQRITALAASTFGAGYGGSCWALVRHCEAKEFVHQWRTAYEERFPNSKQLSVFFCTDPGPGAFRV